MAFLRERIQHVLSDVIAPNQASCPYDSLTSSTEFGGLLETMEDLEDEDLAFSMFKDACKLITNALERSKRRKLSD